MKDNIQEDNKVKLPVTLSKEYTIDDILSILSCTFKVFHHGNLC